MAHPDDIYGSFGSVPNQQPLQASGATPLSVRATPNDFGAQIGEGLQRIGEQGKQLADHYGGLMLETAANEAEVAHINEVSNLKADFMQKEGSAAVAARPAYEQAILESAKKYRSQLPMAAARMFDMNVSHFNANQLGGAATYAAEQAKSANLKSHEAISNLQVSSAGDINNVLDDDRFGMLKGNILHSANAIADVKGWTTNANGSDDATGELTFSDTPEGQASKAQYTEYKDAELSKLYLQSAKTITDVQGAAAAGQWVEKHKGDIPPMAQAQLNQYLAPKMKSEFISGTVHDTLNQYDTRYNHAIVTGAPLSVRNNNPGNIKDPKTGEFIKFATPEEGAAAMEHDLSVKISGNSAAMEKNYGKGYTPTIRTVISTYAPSSENDTEAYINTVSKGAGISPDTPLTQDDIKKIMPVMQKVEGGTRGTGYPKNNQESEETPQQRIDRMEYLKGHEEDIAEEVRGKYLEKYPDDQYGGDRAAGRAKVQIQKILTMDNNRLNAGVDSLNKAMFSGDKLPTSLDELTAFHPELEGTVAELRQRGKTNILNGLDKALQQNVSAEQKKGYGNGFLSVLNRISGDDADPDTIKDAHALTSAYGEKSDLYLGGYKKLNALLQQAQTPDGRSKLARQAQFLTALRGKMLAGAAGDMAFNKALPAFFSQYSDLDKEGKADSMLSFDDSNKFIKSLNLPNKEQITSSKIKNTLNMIEQLKHFQNLAQ